MILVLSLIDRNGRLEHRLVRPEDCPFVIGRADPADWRLQDLEISRRHCVIDTVATGFVVTDVSVNGVFVNDETEPLGPGISRPLVDRTRLRLGGSELRVKIPHDAFQATRSHTRHARTEHGGTPPSPSPIPVDLSDVEWSDLLSGSFGGAHSPSPAPSPPPFNDPFTLDPPIRSAPEPAPARFLSGRVFFRVPSRMWKELPEVVELRLSPRQVLSKEEQREIAASFRPGGGAVDQAAVARLGRRMNAQLLADPSYFRVEPLSSPDQDIDLEALLPLRWDWRISPLRTGRTRVRLRLSIRQDALGAVHEVDTTTFEREVEVRIRSMGAEARRFWRDNWKWVLTTGGGLGTAATMYGWAAGIFRG